MKAWELRGRKNQSKHKIGKIDTALRRDLLWIVLVGWKRVRESCPCDDPTLTSGFRNLLYSCRLKVGTQTAVLAKQLKNLLRSGKQSYMTDVVEGIPDSACASQILTLMKPCIGTSNSRKRSRPCLPYVLNDKEDKSWGYNSFAIATGWAPQASEGMSSSPVAFPLRTLRRAHSKSKSVGSSCIP